MANFKALPIAAAVATALVAMSASAVEFHGYFRAGFGLNADGGSQYCYGNGGPDAHSVGRLGNECDTYAELALSENVYEKNGEAFSVHTLVAYGTEEGNTDRRGNSFQRNGLDSEDGVGPWEGQRMSFREAYAKYKMKSGTELWAGNRFYGRKDVHIWDLYYVNGSGYGAGVDNIKAGPGAIAIAVRNTKWKKEGTTADANQPLVATPQLDLRYNGLSLGALGSLDLIAMYGKAWLSDAQEAGTNTEQGDGLYPSYNDKAGIQLTAELSTAVLGGFNKIVAQYSTEGYGWSGFGMNNHLGDAYNIEGGGGTGREAWRLIDHGVVKFGKQFALGYAAQYSMFSQYDYTAGVPNAGWAYDTEGTDYGVTLRPQFMWNDTMSTLLEVGYNSREVPWIKDAQDLTKVTLAQAWSPLANGGFWARPQIRVFVSQYGGDRQLDDNETMVGAQVEAWW